MPRIILDTHVAVRWFVDPKKLSREQHRLLIRSAEQLETIALSAMTLLEIAMLAGVRTLKSKFTVHDLLGQIEESPVFQVLPLNIEIAKEASYLTNALRDPGDCVIVATARVHGLHLVTSDERIVASNLVSTID